MTTTGTPLAAVPAAGLAEEKQYRMFVRDLVVPWNIGVYEQEQGIRQRVRFNLDLIVREPSGIGSDEYSDVVCYEKIVKRIHRLSDNGHVNLVETLADQVAVLCLQNRRVLEVTVRIEKLDVFTNAASVGIEIHRTRDDLPNEEHTFDEPAYRVISDG